MITHTQSCRYIRSTNWTTSRLLEPLLTTSFVEHVFTIRHHNNFTIRKVTHADTTFPWIIIWELMQHDNLKSVDASRRRAGIGVVVRKNAWNGSIDRFFSTFDIS
jgi:hypothetical protein